MTRKEIALSIAKLTCYPTSVIDVDLFLFDCRCKPCNIVSISSSDNRLVVLFDDTVKGYCNNMFKYVMVDTKWR